MSRFATITPDRGDRPDLLAFCKRQLERMDPAPEKSYMINYAPTSPDKDLTPRVKHGIELAKADGFEVVYIIENDDYYPSDYFAQMDIGTMDFVGAEFSTYYNLRNLTYSTSEHRGRSSLFNTGFRIKALDSFKWPADKDIFLDLALWQFARGKRKLVSEPVGVGMKHGIGLAGGKGHKAYLGNLDEQMAYLKRTVDKEAFEFYQKLREIL